MDYLLLIDEHLRTSYNVYQNLLDAFDTKEVIINALKYPYSNGKLEGKNNLIKAIKRVAFGFRTFRHLRMRIPIQQNLWDIIWAKKNKKKKGNAEVFSFSDLMKKHDLI